MTLKNKKILIISPEPWSHIFVSKHHYAIELSKRNNQVYFLNPPTKNYSCSSTKYKNLSVIDYKGFPKGMYLLPKFVRSIILNRIYKKLEKLANTKFDIIWSFDNSVFYDFDCLPKHLLKISHIVDLNMNYQFEKAAKTADACFASSEYILNKLSPYNANSFFIHHGSKQQTNIEKFTIQEKEGLKIGYCGNLDIKYLDWELLINIFHSNESVNFYFAGPCSENKEKLKASNAEYLGKLSSAQLNYFYEQIDILIICYKAEEYPKQLANPHKFMEYLASGKPIVATYTEQYKKYTDDIILMSEKNEDFPQLLSTLVSNFEYYNSHQLIEKRKAIALDNTYPKQIERIEKIIRENTNNDLFI